jgi:hypothetical protein
MQVMLDDVTQHLTTGAKMHSATIKIARAEGDVADLFAAHQQTFPDVAMGSYPSFLEGNLSTQLVLRSTDSARLAQAFSALEDVLKKRGFVQ